MKVLSKERIEESFIHLPLNVLLFLMIGILLWSCETKNYNIDSNAMVR